MSDQKKKSRQKPKLPQKPVKKLPTSYKATVIGLGIISAVAIFLLCSWYQHEIDLRVENGLKTLKFSKFAAVYSDPFAIFKGMKIRSEKLEQNLTKRFYSNTETADTAGTYFKNGSTYTIYTHEFILPNGDIKTPTKVSYDTASGKIFSPENKKNILDSLILEPILVGPLGSGEITASTFIPLKDMPAFLPKAFIAIEDNRFYSHSGIDPIGILRAFARNITSGNFLQGGSTITQQLAKNLFFTSEKSIIRKVKEAFAALSLERNLSKDQILELYLNKVYFGRDGTVSIHGVGEAATTFFGKDIKNLKIEEAALLAGLVKGPSLYAPRTNPEKAKKRRDLVIQAMFENGVITNQEKEDALKTDLKVKKDITHAKLAPHFIDATKDELSKDNIDLDETPTLQVFSGLDKELQDCAEDAVTIGLEALEKSYPNLKRKNIPIEGALVAIEPYSGLIKSYVGGRDFSRSQYDRVRLSKRQMGSTFKPFLYLHALEGDKNNPPLTLASELIDEPFTQDIPGGKSWSPENYEGSYNGSVTLRFALEHSLNTPTARLGIQFGADALLNLGKRFFLFDDAPKVLSLSLGVAETSLLQLTAAYGALANNGIYVKPRLFSSAIAELGEIQVGVPITEEKVADENETFLITNILQGVIERGTGKNARSSGFNLPAAGKTGTTNDARDAWFVGFTPSMVAGVWVGFDNNDKIGLTGGLAAAPIWGRFMKCAEPYMDKGDFVKPAWVELRAVEGGEYDEYFVK